MSISRQEAAQVWDSDRQKERKRLIITWAVVIVLFLICMSIRYNAYYFDDKFVPITYLKAFGTWISVSFRRLFGIISAEQAAGIIEAFGEIDYLGFVSRLELTLMSFVAGGALALSGVIFQTTYQNPLASPNIIGASAGVRLGNVLVVALFSYEAVTKIYLRYAYCYGFTIICVGLILLFGRLTGGRKGNYSIVEMVMAGSIVSQVIQVFAMYFMYNLEDEDLLVYNKIAMGTYIDTDTYSMIIFFGVMAIAMVPMIIVRYRMNAVAFSKAEASTLGINVGPLKVIGQICGAIMVTCAMIHFGEAGMITMVVPYILRQTVGADFRKLCTYSILVSGALMMVVRLSTQIFMIADEPIPTTFILNMIMMPLFLVVLARSGKRASRSSEPGM